MGEEEFHRRCVEIAADRVRAGLPLRAEIDCVGLTASVPYTAATRPLLGEPTTPEAAALADEDLEDVGFLTNATRLWMNDPALQDALFDLVLGAATGAGLSLPERGVATITAASLTGDTYCPLAWGHKLTEATTPEVAASVLLGATDELDDRSRAIADWARTVATRPGSTSPADVERLRAAGFDDAQILRLTLFTALRIAFSTVNLTLGARPEQQYVDLLDDAVREAWQAVAGR